METDRLKYFCTIAEAGTLTKAASLLKISHSGLSKSISALEQELNVQLFQPSGRGLEITREGKLLYSKALEILKSIDQLHMEVENPIRPIRIGLSEVLSVSCSGLLASDLENAAFYNLDIGELEGKIFNGDIDFGIAFVPAPKPEMEYLKLGMIRFSAFARKDLVDKNLSTKVPFVVPWAELPSNPMNYRHRDGWPLGITRNPRYQVNSFSIAMNLVKAGLAAAYIPYFIVKMENALLPDHAHITEVKSFEQARTERPVFLVKQTNSPETLEMKCAAKIFRRSCCIR